MSFFDDASLVFLPSGQAGKDGKAYSMKPTDGSGDFTFSRGSNLTATRIDSNGLIEKGRENLLLQSNQFDTTWATYNTSVTSGQSGYDGSNDAWLLNKSGADGRVFQNISFSGVTTFSIYAKANTNSWIRLFFNTISVSVFFDLANGVKGNSSGSGLIDSQIQSIGNGWYRCSVTMNGSGSACRVYPAEANTTSATSGSIYIQDAQLEIGLAPTEPILSGATTGLAGILEDSPRFDYSGGASCPSLLLEGSRTNLIGYSEYIQGLSLTDLTPTPNATTSPEGLQNAYKVLTGTAGSEQIAYQATGTSGNIKTQSVYIKADSGVQWIRFFQLRSGFANSASCWFDIQNGVKGSKSEGGTTSVVDDATKIEDAGNGWYRLILVCTDSTNTTTFDTRIRTAIADNSGTRVSNGSYFVWGLQMESDASYPTSYIPNHSGGSVTRNAEQIVNTNISSIINTSNSYTIFFDFTRPNADYTSSWQIVGIDNGGYTSRLKIIQRPNFDQFRVNVYDGSTNVTGSNIDNSAQNKIAVVYDGRTSYKIFTNGTLLETLTCGAINGTRLISGENGTQRTIENHKQVIIFPSALSDAECITLTS